MRGEYYLALVDDLLPDIVTHVEQLQQLSEVCAPGLGHAANQTCKRCLTTFGKESTLLSLLLVGSHT